jgi:hypothetical protein
MRYEGHCRPASLHIGDRGSVSKLSNANCHWYPIQESSTRCFVEQNPYSHTMHRYSDCFPWIPLDFLLPKTWLCNGDFILKHQWRISFTYRFQGYASTKYCSDAKINSDAAHSNCVSSSSKSGDEIFWLQTSTSIFQKLWFISRFFPLHHHCLNFCTN